MNNCLLSLFLDHCVLCNGGITVISIYRQTYHCSQFAMWSLQANISVKFVVKIFLQIMLLVMFLKLFGIPSIEKYLENKVLVLVSRNETEGIPAPAVTICGYSQTQGSWKTHSSLQQVLAACNHTADLFACVQSKAWDLDSLVFEAFRGFDLKKNLMNSNFWSEEFYKEEKSCYTFKIDLKIRTHYKTDQIFFHLNTSLQYMFFIHSPSYFIQNYNPLGLPMNEVKVLTERDCNKYLTVSLTKYQELNTVDDPCENAPTYSFTSCVEDSLAKQVGCGLSRCKTARQYRQVTVTLLNKTYCKC